MRGLPRLLLHRLRKIEWNGSHGNGCISERDRNDLVTAATDAARTHLDGFSDNPADSEGDVTNFNAGDDAEAGVENQAEECTTQSEGQTANKGGVGIFWNLILELINTTRAGQ